MWICLLTAMAGIASWANEVQERVVEFTYTATVEALPSDTQSVLWLPLPQSTSAQTIRDVRVDAPWEYEQVEDATYRNQFLRFRPKSGTGEQAQITVRFVVSRKRGSPQGIATLQAEDSQSMEKYLRAGSLIRTDGEVAREASRVVGKETQQIAKARMLYDHIVGTVAYDKSGEDWGRGDSLYACDVRTGNCTDFHSLFIGEARSQGIPSRFIMGFSIPNDQPAGSVNGYHCWAEFHIKESGWTPIDASEAQKNPDRKEELFGGLDANRVQFTVGRDIELPGMRGMPINYSIYPYLEINGEPGHALTWEFSYRSVDQDGS